MIEAGWNAHSIPGMGKFWQPMVAGINEVKSETLVPGPCFLQAVVHLERGSKSLQGTRVPCWRRHYGFVTTAAQHNVAHGRQCGFYLTRELASWFLLGLDYSLTSQSHCMTRPRGFISTKAV